MFSRADSLLVGYYHLDGDSNRVYVLALPVYGNILFSAPEFVAGLSLHVTHVRPPRGG